MASIISGNINLSKINKDKIYEGKKVNTIQLPSL